MMTLYLRHGRTIHVFMLFGFQDVDARDKRGHDESITRGRWYQTLMVVRSRALRGVSNREASREATMIRVNRKAL
jgi:hypothetical protein